jgi:hypothetical protein
MNSVQTLPPTPFRFSLILYFHLHLIVATGLFLLSFPSKILLFVSHFFHTCSAHPIFLDLIILKILGAIIKLLIMELSSVSHHFLHLRSKYSFQQPVLEYPQFILFYCTLKIKNWYSGGWSPIGSTRHWGHQLAYCAGPGWLWWWRNWSNDWQGKPKYSEKTCPSATLSTKNPTCCPNANAGRRGGKPVTNRLNYGKVLLHPNIHTKPYYTSITG